MSMRMRWAVLVTAGVFGCQGRPVKEVSPELRAFQAAFERLRDDMTEQEVSAVMAGYPCTANNAEHVDDPLLGKPLRRPSVRTLSYAQEEGSAEGDYTVQVLFDAEGRVVWKQLIRVIK